MYSLQFGQKSLSHLYHTMILILCAVCCFTSQAEAALFPQSVGTQLTVQVMVANTGGGGSGSVSVNLYVMDPGGNIHVLNQAPDILAPGQDTGHGITFITPAPKQGTYVLGALIKNSDANSTTVEITSDSFIQYGPVQIFVDQTYVTTTEAGQTDRLSEVNAPMVYSIGLPPPPP